MTNPFDGLGHVEFVKPASPELISKYQGVLPRELLDVWRSHGFVSCLDGLLWMVNPEDYADVLCDWVEDAQACHMILRSAFGHFWFVRDGVIYMQGVQLKLRTELGPSWRLLVKFSLSRPSTQENVLHQRLYRQAVKAFGPLRETEMFGFAPALAAGGTYSLESIQKLGFREHLSVLAQL